MTTVQSIIMGTIQGVTEFLPVSSSAHLIVVPWFLHIDDGDINKLTYDVMLHLGSLVAILFVYGKKFIRVVVEGIIDFGDRKTQWCSDKDGNQIMKAPASRYLVLRTSVIGPPKPF